MAKHKYLYTKQGEIKHAWDKSGEYCGGRMKLLRPSKAPGYMTCTRCKHQEDVEKLIDYCETQEVSQ